jgi:hypothetical protein
MALNDPVVLTAADFIDGRLASPQGCTLVIAHANLVGVTPAEGDGPSKARELLEAALEIADVFQEMHVGLLNCLDFPATAEQLSVYVSDYGTRCATLIFTDRPTTSREEIIVRLAYDLTQPTECDSPHLRWDDAEIRTMAILAARETLEPLYEEWVPGFDG